MNTPEPKSTPAATLPSSSVIGGVSLLLVIHLFAVVVAGVSNQIPVEQGSEPLRTQFRRTPGLVPYLRTFGFDWGFNHPRTPWIMTDGSGQSVDHSCDVVLDWPANAEVTDAMLADMKRLPLLPAGTRLGIRKRRYRQLATYVGLLVGDDETESNLPKLISERLIAERGLTEGTHRFRCRQHLLLNPENARSNIAAERDPFRPSLYDSIYQADLVIIEGEVVLSKVAGRGEVTQVDNEDE